MFLVCYFLRPCSITDPAVAKAVALFFLILSLSQSHSSSHVLSHSSRTFARRHSSNELVVRTRDRRSEIFRWIFEIRFAFRDSFRITFVDSTRHTSCSEKRRFQSETSNFFLNPMLIPNSGRLGSCARVNLALVSRSCRSWGGINNR